MGYEIKHRYSGDVLYTHDGESAGQAVLAALRDKADLSGADLTRADLYNADLKGADLTRADLFGADLYNADLKGADLTRADLKGADLSGADLTWADLFGAALRGANLRGANLGDANLRGANLRGANLGDANLRGADLRGADLRDANLFGARSVVELPVADPRSYRMIATQPKDDGEWLITAGCRGPWTLAEAYAHWRCSDYDGNDLIRRRYVCALDWWEREGADYRAAAEVTS